MECTVCQVRSSVGFCAECQILLCDDCGIVCTRCGKLVCSQHVHETRSHKKLCPQCMEERKARAAERAAAAEAEPETSLEALEAEQVGEVTDEALVGSVRQPPPPWQLSAITAGVGVLVMIALIIFPSMRHIDMPGGSGGLLYVPYFLLFVPAIAVIWGVVGLVGAPYQMDRSKALIGIVLSAICLGLAVYAVQTDPAREAAEKSRQAAQQLRSASPEQIKQQRENILGQFK